MFQVSTCPANAVSCQVRYVENMLLSQGCVSDNETEREQAQMNHGEAVR